MFLKKTPVFTLTGEVRILTVQVGEKLTRRTGTGDVTSQRRRGWWLFWTVIPDHDPLPREAGRTRKAPPKQRPRARRECARATGPRSGHAY